MSFLQQIPQQVKVAGDVVAPVTAGAYMMNLLPSTWGEWAACLAGLWALIQIADFIYKRFFAKKGTKRKRRA